MVFEVNGVKAIGATAATGGVQAQAEQKVGTIPIGQNGNEYKQKTALKSFENDVQGGNVTYKQPNLLAKLTNGDENHYIIGVGDGNTKLSDIAARYNLSEEALYNGGNIIDGYGGGAAGSFKVPVGADGNPYIKINAKDLSTAPGISEENLKAMVQG